MGKDDMFYIGESVRPKAGVSAKHFCSCDECFDLIHEDIYFKGYVLKRNKDKTYVVKFQKGKRIERLLFNFDELEFFGQSRFSKDRI